MTAGIEFKKLQSLDSTHAFRQLPSAFYSELSPSPIDNPQLVIASEECANLLDLNACSLAEPGALEILSGQTVPDNWRPLAMKYFGHQFGYLNPDLGDGRGLLMAQVRNHKNEVYDLHLKGAGTTPYSRGGDGRAVLRSSIREFLASEALAALHIPTTRALAVVSSTTPVMRETPEKAACLMRVTKSHIRFGHFEFAYHSKDRKVTEALANHVIQHHYPCFEQNQEGYADLFRTICTTTAKLIADWQSLGFAHGVMNTDNMSILGETFDFGPYGFMDRFRSAYICNHSDHEGRYAFDRQPAIAHWNLSVLAQALTPILDNSQLTTGLQAYSDTFNSGFLDKMRNKLGLGSVEDQDSSLIFSTLQMLQGCRLDYPRFFRSISAEDMNKGLEDQRNEALDLVQFDDWKRTYLKRIDRDDMDSSIRSQKMREANPKIVLRNHLAQRAIEAAENGDYSVVRRLHQALLKPFEDKSEFDDLAALPPDWAEELEVSCSS